MKRRRSISPENTKFLNDYGSRIRKCMIDYEISESDRINNGAMLHWDRSTLRHGCFMASDLLKYCVESSKFVLGLVYTKENIGCCNHCWIEMGDSIVDLTATQFNSDFPNQFPDVYIIFKNDIYNKNRDKFFYLPLYYDNDAKTLLASESARKTIGCHYNQCLLEQLRKNLETCLL